MARTSITTARYNPFTMEELYSPVLRATEQHLQQQEKYDELANQASVWKYRLPQEGPVRDLYNSYMEKFDVAVNDLNEHGIGNPSARDNVRALIRENPIPAFIETQNQLDKWNDTKQKLGPNTLFVKDPTFEDFFYGKANTDYVDLDKVNAKAQNDIALVARTLTQEPAFKKATGAGGQYFNVASTTGITDAMWQMARDKKNGASFGADLDAQLDRLNNTVDNIYTYAKYDQFAGQNGKREAIDAAIQNGLQAGSAVTSYKPVQDNTNEMAYKWANYNLSKAGQDAQMYLHGMVPDGKGGYIYDSSVAAEVAGNSSSSSSSGSSGVLGLADPYNVYSFQVGEDGKVGVGTGNYGKTTTNANGTTIVATYKNMEDFAASKKRTGEVIVPQIGWGAVDLNKPLTYNKGNSITRRDALMQIFKERTGVDYRTYYDGLDAQIKSKWSSAEAFADAIIKTKLLPNYNIAIGSNNLKNGKATDWEVYIENKSPEKRPPQSTSFFDIYALPAESSTENSSTINTQGAFWNPYEIQFGTGVGPINPVTQKQVNKAVEEY